MTHLSKLAVLCCVWLATRAIAAEEFLLTFDEYRSVENRLITPAAFANEIPNNIPERTPEHRMEVVVRVGQPFRVRTLEGNREIVLSGVLRKVEQDQASVQFQRLRAVHKEKPLLPDGVTPAPPDLTTIKTSIAGALDTTIRVGGLVTSATNAEGSRTEITMHTITVARWTPPKGE